MDDELKEFLTRIHDSLGKRIDTLEDKLTARADALDAKVEKVETTLLTEFHKWASPVEARARGSRDIVHALELEVDLLKDRVRKLEGEHPTQ